MPPTGFISSLPVSLDSQASLRFFLSLHSIAFYTGSYVPTSLNHGHDKWGERYSAWDQVPLAGTF
ncbi:hypothetical protein MKX36_12210 [Paenibacillus sp. FSL W8-0439]|uniref:hypothetical protein n=1 Tax=Paenibacillus sp. FSL W8-0439 TaxID=2921716 RepID=UPI0030FCAC34